MIDNMNEFWLTAKAPAPFQVREGLPMKYKEDIKND